MVTLRAGYLLLFGGAALACCVATWRATRITDADTRTGMVALLLFSATWAAVSVGRLLPVSPPIQKTFYVTGLVVGLASVGGWLYFCSAYAGHDYHRRPTVRVLAVGVFSVVTCVKLTNPLHHLYFTSTTASDPFARTVIELNAVHWVVTGLAYALTAVGFYLLYEVFTRSKFDTTRLGVLVGITGVPAVFDVLAYTEAVPALLLKFNYEPVGVAVFAVGALYVVDETFVAVPQFWRQQVFERLDEAIVVTGPRGRIRDYNETATEMFPNLAGGVDASLAGRVPALAASAESETDMIEREEGGTARYYRVRTTPLSLGGRDETGLAFICADVTDIERHRRDLQQQTEQFDDFAEAVSHELRNAVTVIDGYLDVVAERIGGDREGEHLPIERVDEAADRMRTVIRDLTTLARYGRPPDTVGECDLGAVVGTVRADRAFEDLACEVTADGRVAADRMRLAELFRNLFRFARANGASRVTIAVEDDAVTITDDGAPLSPERAAKAIEYGEPVPTADAGMSLPNVRTLARAHGWETSVDPTYEDGVRIRLDGVDAGPTTGER